MTKDELKAGYLVELKNGRRYVIMDYCDVKENCVLPNFILIDEHYGYVSFTYDKYLHDVEPTSYEDLDAYDIEKVWGIPNKKFTIQELFNTSIRNLLWQREVKEMTLAEVCDALGCEVKIVK